VEFRKKARDFALKFVNIQRKQFKRLGLIADWQRPYLTLDFSYEAAIIRAFAGLVKAKYIYHGLKPINWCIGCETALAEAEVEFEDRRSPSIYVKFPLLNAGKVLKKFLQPATYNLLPAVSCVIWTTTPWTLLSNVAIALHPKLKYSLIEISPENGEKEILILADDLVNDVMRQLEIKKYKKVGGVKGAALENLNARHPFLERDSRLVLADYVSNQDGTGCVHTAPGHGQEDYLTGQKYKLPVIMPVDEKGRFDKTCAEFSGVGVFQANEMVIDRLKKNKSLLYADTTLHSYPHCWRCKKPLITRSTRQWFMDVDRKNLRKKALKIIQDVQWIPQGGQSRISSMVQSRPDWCLSRQRFWGVPIPVFYCKSCGKELLEPQLIERVAAIVAESGSDAWFTKSVEELLGKKIHCSACKAGEFIKEEDIIDVWFDSGVSHRAVLAESRELRFPASLYLEGSDQHRGWFQTALLTSIPLTGKAPYRKVLTHGFVVDGEGKKMSKSRGNVTSPQETISPRILTSISDAYRKIRNTLRFLIGNLHDFTAKKKVNYSRLEEIDKWALSSLTGLLENTTREMENFRYIRVFRQVHNFCVQQMSSFYLDVLKDRLYTFGKDSIPRRSAQTVIYELLTTLTKILAPILTFTAEEVWGSLAENPELGSKELILLQRWPKVKQKWINPSLDEKMAALIKVRDAVLKEIENKREKGIIRNSLEAGVRLYVSEDGLCRLLRKNLDLLVSIFIVSDVSVEKVSALPAEVFKSADDSHLGITAEKINFPKCQRCWNYRDSVGKDTAHPQLCKRCVEVIEGSGLPSVPAK
jgi:isoleucyl-tRNA synthetase